MAKSTKERLAALEKKEAQIQERKKALKQQEAQAERKKDTRRKILIGGAILAKVKRGAWTEQQLVELLNDDLRNDRDRELFDLPPLAPQ